MNNIDEEVSKETYGLFGVQDDICDFRQEFKNVYGTKQFGSAEVFKNTFIPIFEQVEKDFNERVW